MKTMRAGAAAVFALACLAAPLGGRAQQQEAGTVVAIEGDVTIQRGAQTLDAKIKDPIYPSDVIRTSHTGRIKIFFDRSSTVTTIAEDSAVTITESYYRGNRWKGLFSLSNGRLRLDIEQAFGKDVSVVTPNAIAGAKGTSFVVRYDPGEELSTILVLRGQVSFGNSASKILVGSDQWSTIRRLAAPAPAAAAPPEVVTRESFRLSSNGAAGGVSRGELPLPPPGRFDALDRVRTQRLKGTEKISDNPQVDALTQSGAFIVPGPLAVAPDVKPPPPVPPAPPGPPKPPGPAPIRNLDGGGGGPL